MRNNDVSDAALVARAQDGDRSSFATLYERHGTAVARLVRSRVGSSDADDVVAETFARAWQSLPRYRDHGVPFVAWLFGITRNVVADSHRKRWRMRPAETVEGDPSVDHAAKTSAYLDLREAVGALNKRQQQVIELKYLGGLTNDEVARALELSPGAVNTLQWRALQKLQQTLGEA